MEVFLQHGYRRFHVKCNTCNHCAPGTLLWAFHMFRALSIASPGAKDDQDQVSAPPELLLGHEENLYSGWQKRLWPGCVNAASKLRQRF